MKKYISGDWNTGKARIMIATSAWGMGINDRGVERVIQWSITHLDNLDTLIQRFGRCARDIQMQGLCLLFTEKCSVGARAPRSKNRKNDENGNKRATAAERRAGIDEGLYKFINTPGLQKYKRIVILGYFGDPDYKNESLASGPWCDNCSPEVLERLTVNVQSLNNQAPSQRVVHTFPRAPPSLQFALKTALIDLRAQLFKHDYPDEDFLTDTDIFDDQQLSKFSLYCRGVRSKEHLLLITGLTMDKFLYNTYAEEISTFITTFVAGYIQPQVNPPQNIPQAENRGAHTILPPTIHDKYAGLTNEALKALLRARLLPVSGPKTQLLDRLARHDSLLAVAGKPDIPAMTESHTSTV